MPQNVLKREAARFEIERIQTGTALGEVDHPSYSSRHFRSLNLANVSHHVLDIRRGRLWRLGGAAESVCVV